LCHVGLSFSLFFGCQFNFRAVSRFCQSCLWFCFRVCVKVMCGFFWVFSIFIITEVLLGLGFRGLVFEV
jgi:hypothetical protein